MGFGQNHLVGVLPFGFPVFQLLLINEGVS